MKSTFTHQADFWQERDFGKKISAAFDFIGAHFKPLGKCLLYFVLPFTLVLGMGFGTFVNSMYDQLGGRSSGRVGSGSPFGSMFGGVNFGAIGLMGLSGVLAFIMLSATVYGYVRVRLSLPPGEVVTPALVWAEIKDRLGRVVLGFLLLLVGGGLTFGLAFGALFGFFAMGNGLGGGLGALGVLVLGVGAAYVGVALSLYFPILWLEDVSLFEAIGRSFHLIKGKWWSTFGLSVVASFLQSLLTYVFAIPQYVVMFGKAAKVPGLDSDILGLTATSVYAMGAIFTYALPLLAILFQYFNLVEMKEGRGLRLLVDQLGAPAITIPEAQSSYYQPDDEGEY